MVAILSECARVWSGVTYGTVITVTVSDRLRKEWQAEQFYRIGCAGGGSVDGQRYTQQQCFIKALEIDDQHANAWYRLGLYRGGSVGGQQYTQQQCHIKALELNDQHADAWMGLGQNRGGSVGGQQYTRQQCHDKYNEFRASVLKSTYQGTRAQRLRAAA